MSLLFLSDNHFGTYGGRIIADHLRRRHALRYMEDDYGAALAGMDYSPYRMLVTCAIGDTPNAPHAPPEAEAPLRDWLATGVPILLLHGGSAAFWKWDWWRELVALRWVRGEDPAGVAPSTHPVEPYELYRSKGRHPLIKRLDPMSVPRDELYIELEETRPLQRLLETDHGGRSHAMAYASTNQWGGQVLGHLPGHDPKVVSHPTLLANIDAMVDYALKER